MQSTSAKKITRRIPWLIVLLIIAYVIFYCWRSFPIISGYGAKNMCSAVFLAGRSEQQEREQELGFFPMKYGTFTVDYKDSSVTGSVFGFAKRKAIYRKGLGATLVSELTEEEVRAQSFPLATPPALNQDTINWPMGNKTSDSFPSQVVDRQQLEKAVADAFIEKDSIKPVRTRAVIVLYNGEPIVEQYGPGFSKDTRLAGWSMTKSITNTLVGMLVKDGKLDITAPAPVPEWNDIKDNRHLITIKDLLQQSSGLKFNEVYSRSSDATRMLFQHADMGAYTATHLLKQAPGEVFNYSSGNTNILSRIIRQTVGEHGYHAFPYDSLFYKLGMYSAIMEPDASGTFVGSSYMYATARDWARFGLLYLNNGLYNGQRILTQDWIQQTITPAKGAKRGEYGYQFWLNAGEKGNVANRKYPHCPTDMYCADGFEGQFVFIVPSKKLVVVRLGLTQHDNFNADLFLSNIVSAVH